MPSILDVVPPIVGGVVAIKFLDIMLQHPRQDVGMGLMSNHDRHKDIRLLDRIK